MLFHEQTIIAGLIVFESVNFLLIKWMERGAWDVVRCCGVICLNFQFVRLNFILVFSSLCSIVTVSGSAIDKGFAPSSIIHI